MKQVQTYRLIIALLVLGWIGTLPLTMKIRIQHVPVVHVELDPLTIEKNEIKNQLLHVYNMNPIRAEWWSHQIVYASHAHQVPSNILLSVIKVESSFIIDAKSRAGAVGPAQIVHAVWKTKLGLDLDDPIQNIYAGAYILKLYYNECGDWRCAIKSYNVGITNYNNGRKKRAQSQYIQKVKSQLALIDSFSLRQHN